MEYFSIALSFFLFLHMLQLTLLTVYCYNDNNCKLYKNLWPPNPGRILESFPSVTHSTTLTLTRFITIKKYIVFSASGQTKGQVTGM